MSDGFWKGAINHLFSRCVELQISNMYKYNGKRCLAMGHFADSVYKYHDCLNKYHHSSPPVNPKCVFQTDVMRLKTIESVKTTFMYK